MSTTAVTAPADAQTTPKKGRGGRKKAVPAADAPNTPSSEQVTTAPSAPRKPRNPNAASLRASGEALCARYIAKQWTITAAPKGSINDFIAAKNSKMHFIQLVPADQLENEKYTGIARNTFIQNAFSNGAIPVYGNIGASDPTKIALIDVNLNSTIRIA